MGDQASRKHRLEDDNANALMSSEGLQDGQKRARKGVERTGFTAETDLETGTSASAITAATGAVASAGAETASSAAPIAARLPIVLVSVGGGPYSDVAMSLGAIREMRRMALLIALSESKGFANDLKDVPLGQCHVFVITSTAKKPADGVRGTEVETTDTFGDVIATDLPAGTNVFIRVELSQGHTAGAMAGAGLAGRGVPTAGKMPFDATLGIPEGVWTSMCETAQSAAKAAGQHRALLAGLPGLHKLHASITSAAAQPLGIQVIRADAAGNVAVGVFDVPQLRRDITMPPKTFDDLGSAKQPMLLLPQRLKCSFEFVDAVATPSAEFGVLLSGPNGVGKSGIGLLAYLICMARKLPVAYISRCEDWVGAASSKAGGGDEYFLETLWRQNADVISATPALRTVFAAALHGDGSPFTADVMRTLQLAVAAPNGPRVGVIMDEVQHITQAVAKVQGVPTSSVTAPRQLAGDYFATSWHDWTNSNSVFPRLSIASAHGERDFKLPDGEAHRLRIVEPLDPADTAALQACPSSPAYVFHPSTRGRIVFMAGDILRKLVEGASLLPKTRAPLKAELQAVWHQLWVSMVKDCSNWLASMPSSDRDECARQVKALLRGELEWSTTKPLYDAGIVYRTSASALVHPVSAAASAVILHVTAAHVRAHPKDIRLIEDGRQRGFELEDQVFSFLNPVNQLAACKLLDGSPGPALQLQCQYSLPFKELTEVVPRDVPVLYRPLSGTYPCDGILMPKAEDESGSPSGEIILVECSTDNPRLAVRIDKVRKWYLPEVIPKALQEADRVATALKARYPAASVVVALCYDKELNRNRKEMSEASISLSNGMAAAPAVGNMVRVLDCIPLRSLGLVL